MCLDYKIAAVENVSNSLQQILSASFYACDLVLLFTTFQVVDYFILKVLICTPFLKRYFNSISCIYRQVKVLEFTKSEVRLLRSALMSLW